MAFVSFGSFHWNSFALLRKLIYISAVLRKLVAKMTRDEDGDNVLIDCNHVTMENIARPQIIGDTLVDLDRFVLNVAVDVDGFSKFMTSPETYEPEEDEEHNESCPNINLMAEDINRLRIKWWLIFIVKLMGRVIGYPYFVKRIRDMLRLKRILMSLP